jgi:type IV secretory pathway VirB2 component (pilin)
MYGMLSGMIERWAFARRFVAHEGGYLFRPSLTAPAYFFSAAEREQCLVQFKRQRRGRTAKTIGVVFVAIMVITLAAAWLDVDWSRGMPWWGTGVLVVLMLAMYWRQTRNDGAIPLAIIGSREAVLPPRGWLAAISARLLARSWKVHLATGVYLGVLCWLFYPRPASIERHPWYPWVYGALAGLLIAEWIWISWAKATRSADLPQA